MRSSYQLEKRSLSWRQWGLLAGLLVLPACALVRLSHDIDFHILLSCAVLVSLAAFIMLPADKKKAQTNQWRIPESTLHFIEMAGGWPGSFVAQRRYRHKISKRSYQVTFWLITIAYQVISLDYINSWSLSAGVFSYIP